MSQAQGRIALITGANKGIGYEVSRQLGEMGATVLVAARNKELGEAAAAKLKSAGVDAHYIQLDVVTPATITAAAKQVEQQFGHIDILVNNAGIFENGKDNYPGTADLDSVRRTFDVNFFGVLQVTQAFLPLIRKSKHGRIVNVSSGLGSLTKNSAGDFTGRGMTGYNSSKAALNMVTVLLAQELADTGIKVNVSNPGYTATDINGNQGTQTVEVGSNETVRLATLPDDGPTGTFSENEGVIPW